MKAFYLLIALFLAGCAGTSVKEMKAPDGSTMKNVKCNMDSQKCLVSASESCNESAGTYRVISSHSNAGGTLADIIPGPVTWYNMTYICGHSDGRMPDFSFRGQQYIPQDWSLRGSTVTNCVNTGNHVKCTSY